MSLFSPQFQIQSDLHLETPPASTTYSYFSSPSRFPLLASNLFLLGDIGLVQHPGLFTFLRSLLARTPNLKVFYLIGNHEAYGITMKSALTGMQEFENETKKEFGERFFFMNRRRIDFSPTLTILGCTLWSKITDEHVATCARILTDFNEQSGIRDRSIEEHNADHSRDLAWLNEQVSIISSTDPHREIIILTHHSPTTHPKANDPRYISSEVNSGFRSDLSQELCWKSDKVKMWSFGHTHYNCQYMDEEDGRKKLVIANQKGYAYPGGIGNWEVKPVVVEAGSETKGWRVIVGDAESGKTNQEEAKPRVKPNISMRGDLGQAQSESTITKGSKSRLRKLRENLEEKLGGGRRKHEARRERRGFIIW